jgi:hypothetical protein
MTPDGYLLGGCFAHKIRKVEGVAAQHRSRGVPAVGVAAYALAMVAGLCSAVALLIVFATGVSGFGSDGWAIAFLASFGATIVFLGLSIRVGVATLSRRGAVDPWDRWRILVAVSELTAIVGLFAAAHFGVGGNGAPLLADVLLVVFVGGLFSWNFWIWRRLGT